MQQKWASKLVRENSWLKAGYGHDVQSGKVSVDIRFARTSSDKREPNVRRHLYVQAFRY